jgi:hypothetical protein
VLAPSLQLKFIFFKDKNKSLGRARWLTPVILAIWDLMIGRIAVQGQPGQKRETPFQPIKAGCGGTPLSSQICGKYR